MQNRKSTQLHEGNRAVIYSGILYRNLRKAHVQCNEKAMRKIHLSTNTNFLYKKL